MADEHGPLTHGRDLTAFLNRIGAVQPNRATALEIARGVNLEIPVDDARHLVPPLTVPHCSYNVLSPAVVGLYSACLIRFQGKGGYVVNGFARTGGGVGCDESQIPLLNYVNTGAINAGIRGGAYEAPLSQVEIGTTNAIPANNERVTLVSNVAFDFSPMFFQPGRTVLFQSTSVNTALYLSFTLQDVP